MTPRPSVRSHDVAQVFQTIGVILGVGTQSFAPGCEVEERRCERECGFYWERLPISNFLNKQYSVPAAWVQRWASSRAQVDGWPCCRASWAAAWASRSSDSGVAMQLREGKARALTPGTASWRARGFGVAVRS